MDNEHSTLQQRLERAPEWQRQELLQLAANYKLTPATLAHKIQRGRWISKPHLAYISARVAAGIARGGARIIISAPPRHGKSELLSVGTPTWVLEKFPQKRVILTGYGQDLVDGFARRVRDNFLDEENHHLLGTRIRDDAQRVDAFLTTMGGGMYSVGLGGAITGRGADLLLIDDYIKEIKEALSPAYRDYCWNWFVTTAFTRLEPNASVIIIATRWHSDDLIGRVLSNLRSEGWEYIEIPAIAESGDILGRAPGEALFPERYPLERLRELQATLGSMFFKALYQQKPVDETKKLTDRTWIKIRKRSDFPEHLQRKYTWMRVWDFAATESDGDFTTGGLLGYNPETGGVIVADLFHEQLSPGMVETTVSTVAEEDGRNVRIRIEREPGSAGKLLVNHYQTVVLPDYNVREIPAVVNKIVRGQPFLAAAENGLIEFLEGPWNEVALDEFDAWPGAPNDDIFDVMAAGFMELTGKKVFSATWGRRTSSGRNMGGQKDGVLKSQGGKTATRPNSTMTKATQQVMNSKSRRRAMFSTAAWARRAK